MKKNFLILSLLIITIIQAQNTRINTYQNIGWYNFFGTAKLDNKFGIHAEYQWRRDNFITDWQQSLLRVGVNYHATPNVLFRLGYAWIETFPYGEIPINALGRDFTEHRIFQMAQLSHKESIVNFSHRFMFEQRFLGTFSFVEATTEDKFPMLNRMRYMFRLQLPLKGEVIQDKTPYLAMYDEIFIGFGNNVNNNVFDQNRLSALVGYRLNKTWRFEAGYLNQIVQFGRQIDNRNVFQNNHGFLINTYLNLDFSK